MLLNKQNATVTLCHSKTKNIQDYLKDSDIVITAVGSPQYFKGEWFKPGSIAIDVGINQVSHSSESLANIQSPKRRIVGDIDFDKAIE